MVVLTQAAWTDSELKASLKSQAMLAMRLGVTGVPAFIIGRHLIPGAVPTDVLLNVARKVKTCRTSEPN